MKFRGSMFALPFLALGMSSALAADVSPVPSQASTTPNSSTSWDQQAAAQYLDDRMDLWFDKASKLRTGQGKTSCVSCHMTVPYALARPALRKAAGVSQPTPQEAKLLEETLRRVDTYGSHEPISKGKDVQSRGSEAVLNLLVLACEDARQNRQVPSGPTRRALDELWEAQRPDGAWNWLDTGLEPYESADSVYYGAALAAMAVGTAPGYAGGADGTVSSGVGKLRSYLKANCADQNPYGRVWLLLASTRLAGLLSRDQIEELTSELQRKQKADGGWCLYTLGPWNWSKTNPPFAPRGKPDAALLSQSDA
jgi:hypothetical protein